MTRKPEPARGAKNYALRLLRERPRSEMELARRLEQKGFSGCDTAQVIGLLKEQRLVDDAAFVRLWCESRLNKPFGAGRIRTELTAKGIAPELIERALARASAESPEGDTLRLLAGEQFAKQKGDDRERARNRVRAFLLRRGFDPEAVDEVVEEL